VTILLFLYLYIHAVPTRRDRAFLANIGKLQEAIGLPIPQTRIEPGDILVVFGANRHIEDFRAHQRIPAEKAE
jgi:hypothetical protein